MADKFDMTNGSPSSFYDANVHDNSVECSRVVLGRESEPRDGIVQFLAHVFFPR